MPASCDRPVPAGAEEWFGFDRARWPAGTVVPAVLFRLGIGAEVGGGPAWGDVVGVTGTVPSGNEAGGRVTAGTVPSGNEGGGSVTGGKVGVTTAPRAGPASAPSPSETVSPNPAARVIAAGTLLVRG
jgi:hypothetical protein